MPPSGGRPEARNRIQGGGGSPLFPVNPAARKIADIFGFADANISVKPANQCSIEGLLDEKGRLDFHAGARFCM
jgi:hypothetical protein